MRPSSISLFSSLQGKGQSSRLKRHMNRKSIYFHETASSSNSLCTAWNCTYPLMVFSVFVSCLFDLSTVAIPSERKRYTLSYMSINHPNMFYSSSRMWLPSNGHIYGSCFRLPSIPVFSLSGR